MTFEPMLNCLCNSSKILKIAKISKDLQSCRLQTILESFASFSCDLRFVYTDPCNCRLFFLSFLYK